MDVEPGVCFSAVEDSSGICRASWEDEFAAREEDGQARGALRRRARETGREEGTREFRTAG